MATFSVYVSKADFRFNCAHFIAFKGFRERLHGHNYQLRVTLTGRPSPKDGMIRDFDEIKRTVTELVLVDCDHHTLNDLMENPTAENMVVWMWDRLEKHVAGMRELQLWETPEYCVTYRK